MPDPVSNTVRPLGLGGLMNILRGVQAAPAVEAPATAEGDSYQFSASAFKNTRFQGDAGLADVASGVKPLTNGATGKTVTRVQQALVDMAFVIPMGATGYYGDQTANAVKNFQSMAGLKRTGTIDQATLAALDKFAPEEGKTSWDAGQANGSIPSPDLGKGKKARVIVDVKQHRAFLFDKAGNVEKIYGVRTGRDDWADGRGSKTQPGIKVIDYKDADPTAISTKLWPDSEGKAFGTRLVGLRDYDLATGKGYHGKNAGQELHGTYQDNSIGRDFSHGCVGLRNQDIEEIFGKVKSGELVKFQ